MRWCRYSRGRARVERSCFCKTSPSQKKEYEGTTLDSSSSYIGLWLPWGAAQAWLLTLTPVQGQATDTSQSIPVKFMNKSKKCLGKRNMFYQEITPRNLAGLQVRWGCRASGTSVKAPRWVGGTLCLLYLDDNEKDDLSFLSEQEKHRF